MTAKHMSRSMGMGKYEELILEILEFENEDVVTDSCSLFNIFCPADMSCPEQTKPIPV